MEDEIVRSVNGKEVKSLEELIEAVEENEKEYVLIETDYRNQIILSREEAEESTERILENYEIPADRSEHFRKDQDDSE